MGRKDREKAKMYGVSSGSIRTLLETSNPPLVTVLKDEDLFPELKMEEQ